MPTYAIAHVRKTNMGAEIVAYLQRIDSTITPFGGRFKVHGGEVEEVEGNWVGRLVIIEFPTRERARSWYASPAYQAIVRLRRNGMTILLVEQNAMQALRIADRAYVINGGRVVLQGAGATLSTSSEIIGAYLGGGP